MKKLNNILNTYHVTAYGFPAFKVLENLSNQDGDPAIVSTLSAAIMADMGIDTYYAPVIPRGTIFSTTDEVRAADLDVNVVHVAHIDNVPSDTPMVIVSQHPGTVSMLRDMYPNNTVFASVTPDDIRDKDVVGALPPNLIRTSGVSILNLRVSTILAARREAFSPAVSSKFSSNVSIFSFDTPLFSKIFLTSVLSRTSCSASSLCSSISSFRISWIFRTVS